MATPEHTALSDFIKSIHKNLREEAGIIGAEEAWKKHCTRQEELNQYAKAMHDLAVNHWENNYKKNDKAISRNDWTYTYCKNYFFNGELIRQRNKEVDILQKISETCCTNLWCGETKLKLLDVGSCYNPFKEYELFNVTAIDIAPATADVLKCDFINLEIGIDSIIKDQEVLQLEAEVYDVIVFSLLLEYLPSPKLRLLCCEKAYSLLKHEGILVIITPDAKHVGANAQLIKSWRFVLSKLGFSRIKYEKLHYLHCMVFRKALNKKITERWVKLKENLQVYDELFIPQDVNKYKVDNDNEKLYSTFLEEVPNFL